MGWLKMQPLGRKPKHFNFEDCHPKKGLINWWEGIDNRNRKRSEKQEYIKKINGEINDFFG